MVCTKKICTDDKKIYPIIYSWSAMYLMLHCIHTERCDEVTMKIVK